MTTERTYEVIASEGGAPIKAWTRGVPLEDEAAAQLRNVARLPFIHKWLAVMPDVHWVSAPPSAASSPRSGR
jgi:tRNA-splicing ligase RtcB